MLPRQRLAAAASDHSPVGDDWAIRLLGAGGGGLVSNPARERRQVRHVLDIPDLPLRVPVGAERLGFFLLGKGSFEVDPHSVIVMGELPSGNSTAAPEFRKRASGFS